LSQGEKIFLGKKSSFDFRFHDSMAVRFAKNHLFMKLGEIYAHDWFSILKRT